MAYCLIDGKVEQESVFETNLYNQLLKQLKSLKAGLRALKFTWISNFMNHKWFL